MTAETGETDTSCIVADADVLAADLLVGGPARDALDHVRRHSWMSVAASDELAGDARAVIADLATEELAADWYRRFDRERVAVDHPSGDHPALASAYRAGAPHLLAFDEQLSSTGANLAMKSHMPVSIRHPDSFARLFDAESLYETLHDDSYPGPDCDPRR